jgi:[ribosomal protein S5]-alanine N-acetyltransferase
MDFERPIIGEKVVIRRLSEDDLDPMYDLESDPYVKHYLDGPAKKPREQWIAAMRNCLNSTPTLAVTEKSSGDFAGRAALKKSVYVESSWELEAVIAKRYWGRHFGREVCQLLIDFADRRELLPVIAFVHRCNMPSLKLCKRLGFCEEGKFDNKRDQLRLLTATPRDWRSDQV